jgi:hypothetical protein
MKKADEIMVPGLEQAHKYRIKLISRIPTINLLVRLCNCEIIQYGQNYFPGQVTYQNKVSRNCQSSYFVSYILKYSFFTKHWNIGLNWLAEFQPLISLYQDAKQL